MIIHLQIDLVGAAVFRRQVKIELPEGATVLDALSAYAQKYNAADILENKAGTAVVVNGARGTFQKVLKEDDRVRVFKPRIRG